MLCKGCNKENDLIEAHIIPKAFFKGLWGDNSPPLIISDVENYYQKRAPQGVYDKNILCRKCEDKFIFDDYAQKVLIQEEHLQNKLYNKREIVAYQTPSIDCDRLKLFFISILWRASVSDLPFYSRINLGGLEEKAKSLIWANAPGNVHDFSFVLTKFDASNGKINRAIMSPITERIEKVRYCRLYLYGYVVFIKIDSQKTPEFLVDLIPSNNQLIILSKGDIKFSKEYPRLIMAAKNSAKI